MGNGNGQRAPQAPLMAVDALGRRTADAESGAPAPRANRRVGLFYFLWLGEHGRRGPYDISRIVAEDPLIGHKPESARWGDIGVYHHWGEPFYGYYCSDDEWVARRHMRLIMQAGVDFLFFDTTNAVIYERNAKLVMRILQEYHDEGFDIPKVLFYTNTESGRTTQRIYESVYQPGYCPDTWFRLEGKPVIIAAEDECSREARAFFCVKAPQWPNEPAKPGGWPWMDFSRPQRVFRNLKGEDEVVSVSVAQHPQLRFGDSVLYGETGNRGRAFHNGRNDPAPDAILHGYNFAEQFDRAIEADPPFVLVTGWNEWIAGRWTGTPDRPVMFVDCANCEYSRDIEMMRGGYFDNYLMQLVSCVRRYKGVAATPVRAPVTVAGGEGWLSGFDGAAVYRGFPDGGLLRSAEGQGGVLYENRTGRNVVTEIRVMHDEGYLYFRLTTKDPVTPYDGQGAWMNVFLNTDGGEGYGYLLNAAPGPGGATALARVTGRRGALTSEILPGVAADYVAEGRRLSLRVPRAAVGLQRGPFTLWFKTADATVRLSSVEDFYDKGDAEPLGRLNFVYRGV